MKVVILVEGLASGVGGIAIHGSELASALAQRGHAVTVVSPEQFVGRRTVTRWFARKVPCPTAAMTAWELPIVWTPRRALTSAQLRHRWKPWFDRLIASNAVEVVHWHGLDVDSYLTRRLPDRCVGIFTNHSSQFLQAAGADPVAAVAAFRHADEVIAPSVELASATVAGGFPASRVHTISNGVDVDRFRPDVQVRQRWRKEHGISDDAIVTVTARRFVEKNGVVYLALAARELARSLKQRIVLCLAGGGAGAAPEYEAEVRRICTELGPRVDVRWLDWVRHQDMPELFAAADIAVLPSLVEATSLAGLEAMASGCVLLGTRVGGIPELVDDGESGRLVPAADPEALARAWRELIDHASLRAHLASAARQRVERFFSWAAVAERTERVYRLGRQRMRGDTAVRYA